jgi:MOSC domain-containing protein YiiM
MTLERLQNTFLRAGRVEFLSVRRARIEPVEELDAVQALIDKGLEGDHYHNTGGSRQVTLIQAEHLSAMAALLGVDSVPASLTRRNIVVSGLNLLALKGRQFKIGEAILEYSGECHPCSRMEKSLGPGAYNAMRGHGGITAKVMHSGKITVGDSVCVLHANTGN